MRFLVRSGTEAEARELFRTAETVPGVSPTCSASAFRVTTCGLSRSEISLRAAMGDSPGSEVETQIVEKSVYHRENYRRKQDQSVKQGVRELPVRSKTREPNNVKLRFHLTKRLRSLDVRGAGLLV